ncbi:MAG: ABC transporter ATP-binding protein [Myxococcales bacterium]|nr:ABC transporter ATP-binding protein [Myxococcales bacterium]
MSPPPKSTTTPPDPAPLRRAMGVFAYSGRAVRLVWQTSPPLTIALAVLTLLAGLLPAAVAYVGKLIVDGVVQAIASGAAADRTTALTYVAAECGLVALLSGLRRGIEVCTSILRARLGHRVNMLILQKALDLELPQFENSAFYDKLTRARQEASRRPLALVQKTFDLVRNGVSLISYGALLLQFSGFAVLVLALAGLPAFVAEARFAGQAFQLFRWRSPEARKQLYLEQLISRNNFAKEVKLFRLGPLLLDRYRAIFDRVFPEDRDLALKRSGWGFLLGLLATLTFYGAYAWIVYEAVQGNLTLGEMTMYVLLFKQGQSAFAAILTAIGGMYEDNLYVSNLYEFLELPRLAGDGTATTPGEAGPGVRFEDVWFTYPGATEPVLQGVNLTLVPGQKLALVGHNGSGKTTLIKLLCGLYRPDQGRVFVDGRELSEWEPEALRARISVVFQDFIKYQFTVGENIGAGDVDHLDDGDRQTTAARKGMALPFIEALPGGFGAQLGQWFDDGRELSGGQWQKVALSRAFMRADARVIVLDEPTSAMDAEAEATVFEHFRALSSNRIVILISHRFSTVRMADQIIVIQDGRIIEHGNHAELLRQQGHYAHLFSLQAAGYQ